MRAEKIKFGFNELVGFLRSNILPASRSPKSSSNNSDLEIDELIESRTAELLSDNDEK